MAGLGIETHVMLGAMGFGSSAPGSHSLAKFCLFSVMIWEARLL